MKYAVMIKVRENEAVEDSIMVRASVDADDEFIAAEKVINDAKKLLKYKIPAEEDTNER